MKNKDIEIEVEVIKVMKDVSTFFKKRDMGKKQQANANGLVVKFS
jgi:hypothetical protein